MKEEKKPPCCEGDMSIENNAPKIDCGWDKIVVENVIESQDYGKKGCD